MLSNAGRPFTGFCPRLSQENVKDDRAVRITEHASGPLLNQIKEEFAFEPPRGHGHSVVESIAAMCYGKAKATV
ncbi:hypothetical protein [Sphingobium sp. HWE2-09]|uniref:hypothetical protein n=1 Tax=Sphingobium sp. HWE2-09 TaxID=3108390 RepID=UPI002DC0832E|nr:hypothetical protein [Sphingobium sp. HWE2-09]